MNYQNETLPDGAVRETRGPSMTERSMPDPIRKKHMTPRGTFGFLVVEEGRLQFVWEDTGERFDASPGHPVVIAPERFHHVETPEPVRFHVEFYRIPGCCCGKKPDPDAARPGEKFMSHRGCCMGK